MFALTAMMKSEENKQINKCIVVIDTDRETRRKNVQYGVLDMNLRKGYGSHIWGDHVVKNAYTSSLLANISVFFADRLKSQIIRYSGQLLPLTK